MCEEEVPRHVGHVSVRKIWLGLEDMAFGLTEIDPSHLGLMTGVADLRRHPLSVYPYNQC